MAFLRSWRDRNTPCFGRLFVSLAMKPSTALSQEADVGVKWKTNRGCFSSHPRTFGCFVSGIVVDDDMDGLVPRHPGLDEVEEANELLMALALHALADDLALECIEGGEQRGGAMALIIMAHGASAPLLHRQAGLGAVQGLDLALLIDRQDNGWSGGST